MMDWLGLGAGQGWLNSKLEYLGTPDEKETIQSELIRVGASLVTTKYASITTGTEVAVVCAMCTGTTGWRY